jgi:peptidoglycan/LPS O-acetylase OafA/YrhL
VSSSTYRADVDGLRALAVGAVIVFHFSPALLPGGFLGVDIFFVISGYLISGMILEGIRAKTFTILGFYLRRARRILPALLAMLLVVSAVALLVLMPDELQRFAESVTASALFVPNLVLARDAGYFDAATSTKPLLHLWSLGVEEQFYLVWPIALLLFAGRVRLKVTVMVIAAIAVASFVSHLLIAHFYSATTDFYLPFTRFWQLLAGALISASALARQDGSHAVDNRAVPRSAWKSNAMSIVGLLLMVGSILGTRLGGETFVGVAVPATVGAAMFIAAGPAALPNRTVFSSRLVVYVGLISYPLYLWHWPPLSFLRILGMDQGISGRYLRMGAVLFAVVAAMLTYHFIELRVRHRQDLMKLGLRLAGLLGVAAAAGIVVFYLDGLPQRTSLAYDPLQWTQSMFRDDRCFALYGQPENLQKNALCVRTDYTRDPGVVMIGDSHVNMFVPGVSAAYPKESILQIGSSACPFLRNVDVWFDHRRELQGACPTLVDAAYRALTPSARVVILGARVPLYVATPEEYAQTFDYMAPKHFESADFPGASPAEIYERSLARDLALLLEQGREVVLILPLPALNFSPRHCLRIRPVDRFLPAPSDASCSEPRASVDAKLAPSRAIVLRVASALAHPDLHLVDPLDALCDADACHAEIDGKLMYRDDNHLSSDGAIHVWSKIKPSGLRGLAESKTGG